MKNFMKRPRDIFVETLIKLAEKDKNIILLNDDTGFSLFEEFQKKFPKQYYNCGITEQLIIGIAAGLALSGKKPWIYGIIPFVTMRNYEFIRNDICYQRNGLNVKIVGVGGKQYYKFLGFTHNIENNEDIKIMELLPNMKIYTPNSLEEVEKIILKEYKRSGPAYIRL